MESIGIRKWKLPKSRHDYGKFKNQPSEEQEAFLDTPTWFVTQGQCNLILPDVQ